VSTHFFCLVPEFETKTPPFFSFCHFALGFTILFFPSFSSFAFLRPAGWFRPADRNAQFCPFPKPPPPSFVLQSRGFVSLAFLFISSVLCTCTRRECLLSRVRETGGIAPSPQCPPKYSRLPLDVFSILSPPAFISPLGLCHYMIRESAGLNHANSIRIVGFIALKPLPRF